MIDNHSTKRSWIDPDWPLAEDGNPVMRIVIPRIFRSSVEGEPWRPGTPIRLFSQLASDFFFKQPTLTRAQLSELVELFKDEPLPESLRAALVAELHGKRSRKQGRKHIRHSALEQVERVMLPAVYDEAMNDAIEERKRLKLKAKRDPRRVPMTKVPTRRAIALDLVRRRLPTVASMTDARLINLVSEIRTMLCEDDGSESEVLPVSSSV